MDEQDELGIPLMTVAFVVALVIALVIGLGVWNLNRSRGAELIEVMPSPAEVAQSAEAAADGQPYAPVTHTTVPFSDLAPVGEPQLMIHFDVGQTTLSDEAKANVAALAAIVRKMGPANAVVLISGFHDATGSADINAEVAKNRALSVREALVDAGVDVGMIQLRKPEVTLGEGEPAEARRVEVRVQ